MRDVTSTSTGDQPTVATDGREIGERAKATRRKLLNATRKLLARDGLSDMRLVDITRDVDASPATFYQYFADIDTAILALANELVADSHVVLEHLAEPWSSPNDAPKATAFVRAYIDYWDTNGAVLRVRNLKAEEGEPEFRRVRSAQQLPLIQAIAAMVEANVDAGQVAEDTDAIATAAAVLAMLERLTSYRDELSHRGTTPDRLEATLSHIAFQIVTGHVGV